QASEDGEKCSRDRTNPRTEAAAALGFVSHGEDAYLGATSSFPASVPKSSARLLTQPLAATRAFPSQVRNADSASLLPPHPVVLRLNADQGVGDLVPDGLLDDRG